jgi:hypothetical protein
VYPRRGEEQPRLSRSEGNVLVLNYDAFNKAGSGRWEAVSATPLTMSASAPVNGATGLLKRVKRRSATGHDPRC